MKTQSKAASAVSVNLLEDPKNLEAPDHVLDTLAGVRQDAVVVTLLVGERHGASCLVGSERVRVSLPDALVPGITDQGGFERESDLRVTKERQVMHRAKRGGDAHDHVCRYIHQDLHLQRVPLFLAAVPAALLFLGRSHGTSEASTAMML